MTCIYMLCVCACVQTKCWLVHHSRDIFPGCPRCEDVCVYLRCMEIGGDLRRPSHRPPFLIGHLPYASPNFSFPLPSHRPPSPYHHLPYRLIGHLPPTFSWAPYCHFPTHKPPSPPFHRTPSPLPCHTPTFS